MCGIAGALWFDPALAIDNAALDAMVAALRHRGPDDQGVYRSEFLRRSGYDDQPGVALGHRRLSIIDVAASHQPLSNEDGTIWVTFNGEIYNYRELRRRLEGAGHRFATQGDTETIVHLYEDQGVDFLEHLDGMFALALWDAPRRRLVLARDRLGKKPLVYQFDGRRLLFASELKSLLTAPGVARQIDPQALDAYLMYQYIPHPQTIFQGIRKLPPAHWAIVENGCMRTGCYWHPDFQTEVDRPVADVAEELRTRFSHAVQARMQSDVPLGAFLSGGIDSSLVARIMARHSDRPIKTFAIGFDEKEYDETRWARLVADACGAEHHEFRVDWSAKELIPQLVYFYDEPFADSSALPTYCVSRLAREHVTVALTGDGGDELFAGYLRYQAVRWSGRVDRFPGPLRAFVQADYWRRRASRGSQRSFLRRLARFTEGLAERPERRYAEWISIFNLTRRASLYTEEFMSRLGNADPGEFLDAAFRRAAGRDSVTAAGLADLTTYLPCDLLTKVDIASMAHGLECRQPFLDHHVVELAASLPLGMKLRRGDTKWILKHAFADLLPPQIARRKKQGFGVPLARWFRGELRELLTSTLLDERALARGYFQLASLERLIAEHQSGAWDHSHRLWALLFLELWHQRWVD